MKIKFCGIRRIEDIEYVNILKPDYIGYVFADSKRQVTKKEVETLNTYLDKSIIKVGVFRNNSLEEIVDKLELIDMIQLHGDEKQELIDELKKYNKKIIKAISIKNELINSKYDCDFILYDNINPGSGEKFDWTILKGNDFFLAGGININNIKDAIKIKPYCIDVSSGIEKDGVKDFNLMKEIIEKVK